MTHLEDIVEALKSMALALQLVSNSIYALHVQRILAAHLH